MKGIKQIFKAEHLFRKSKNKISIGVLLACQAGIDFKIQYDVIPNVSLEISEAFITECGNRYSHTHLDFYFLKYNLCAYLIREKYKNGETK